MKSITQAMLEQIYLQADEIAKANGGQILKGKEFNGWRWGVNYQLIVK